MLQDNELNTIFAGIERLAHWAVAVDDLIKNDENEELEEYETFCQISKYFHMHLGMLMSALDEDDLPSA